MQIKAELLRAFQSGCLCFLFPACLHRPEPSPLVLHQGAVLSQGDIFGCHDLGGGITTSIQWVEIRDAAKYLLVHRTASKPKNYPGENVNVAKVEKPYSQQNVGWKW